MSSPLSSEVGVDLDSASSLSSLSELEDELDPPPTTDANGEDDDPPTGGTRPTRTGSKRKLNPEAVSDAQTTKRAKERSSSRKVKQELLQQGHDDEADRPQAVEAVPPSDNAGRRRSFRGPHPSTLLPTPPTAPGTSTSTSPAKATRQTAPSTSKPTQTATKKKTTGRRVSTAPALPAVADEPSTSSIVELADAPAPPSPRPSSPPQAAPVASGPPASTAPPSLEKSAPKPADTDAPAADATGFEEAVRTEKGVVWVGGKETCPMCIQETRESLAKATATTTTATDESTDVVMTDASMDGPSTSNALGLSNGQEASSPPKPTPSDGPSATSHTALVSSPTKTVDGQPEVILDSWLSCVRCKCWHHFDCIKNKHPETLPEGLLEMELNDSEAAELIGKWFCTGEKCSTGKATLKAKPKRTSSRATKAQKATYEDNDLDLNPDLPSPVLTSFDLPTNLPSLEPPEPGQEHRTERHVSLWPGLYERYEAMGKISSGGFRRVTPEGLKDEWANEGERGWRAGGGVVVVENIVSGKEGVDVVEGGEGTAFERLGGKLPPRTLTVADVARINGPNQPVEVLSVDTQNPSHAVPGTKGDSWTLQHFADYYSHASEPGRKKVLFNIISYEITGTTLGLQLEPPKAVKETSWVDRHWPARVNGNNAPPAPPVQRYLLMSPKGTFTDWHVDFAASSVYYHVVRGCKVFYFITPTNKHLDAYKRWAGSQKQTMEWLGNSVDNVYKVVIKPGATAFIPAGWIHAVFTPEDSLVYGGNFVHTLAIPMQLKVCEIEVSHNEEEEHRFPFFMMLCWFVAKDYNNHLVSQQRLYSKTTPLARTQSGQEFEEMTPAVLKALLQLSQFLCDWVDKRAIKKMKGNLKPSDDAALRLEIASSYVREPFQLAHEFRSRVILAMKAAKETGAEGEEAAASLVSAEQAVVDQAINSSTSTAATVNGANGAQVNTPTATTCQELGFTDTWTRPRVEKGLVDVPRPGSTMKERVERHDKIEEQVRTKEESTPGGGTKVTVVVVTRVSSEVQWPPKDKAVPAPASSAASRPIAPLAKGPSPPRPPVQTTSAQIPRQPPSTTSNGPSSVSGLNGTTGHASVKGRLSAGPSAFPHQTNGHKGHAPPIVRPSSAQPTAGSSSMARIPSNSSSGYGRQGSSMHAADPALSGWEPTLPAPRRPSASQPYAPSLTQPAHHHQPPSLQHHLASFSQQQLTYGQPQGRYPPPPQQQYRPPPQQYSPPQHPPQHGYPSVTYPQSSMGSQYSDPYQPLPLQQQPPMPYAIRQGATQMHHPNGQYNGQGPVSQRLPRSDQAPLPMHSSHEAARRLSASPVKPSPDPGSWS